jgi:hypothetical protein
MGANYLRTARSIGAIPRKKFTREFLCAESGLVAALAPGLQTTKQNKEETPMNYPAAIATLVLATTTALPAFAATPIVTPLRDAAATSIEMVQYQKAAPHQRVHHTTAHRNGANDPLNAHAAAPGANTPANGTSHCVDGLEGSASSAYPMWELCH